MKKTEKIFEILELFSANEPLLRISDISQRIGLNQSSIHRLLNEMKDFGYIRQDNKGTYQLGFKILKLAGVVLESIKVKNIAMPYLEEFSAKTNCITTLGVLENYEVIYLGRVESPSITKRYFHLGIHRPAHCTSIGKVLLASKIQQDPDYLPDDFKLSANTDKTITDVRELKEHLKKAALDGYATDLCEFAKGIHCFGIPIRDSTGMTIAAMSATGDARYLTLERIEELLPEAIAIANKISFNMGL